MGEIIDMKSRRKFPVGSAESEVSAAATGEIPVPIPTDDDRRLAQALLDEQIDRENEKWVRVKTEHRRRTRYCRASFFLLGVTFGILQWWWAMGVAFIIMMLSKRLTEK